MPGRFITIEGMDGVGKSSQVALLAAWLGSQGVEVVATREPGGTDLGERLRAIALSTELSPQAELLLMAAARSQHVAEVIVPALRLGRWVVCDRFIDSTVAYQGFGLGLGIQDIFSVCKIATAGAPEPNLTLWLDADRCTILERLGDRNLDAIESRSPEYWENVRRGFGWLAATNPLRICRVDASGDEQAIAGQIRDIIRSRELLHEK